MSQLKFASLNDAIQYLSDHTGKNIKIAWRDESKKIMEDIISEVRKKPSLFSKKFKKYIEGAVEPGVKILPTTRGSLKIVEDVDEETMNKLVESLSKAPKNEIFKAVQEDKKSFPEFHKAYDKGLQEQDGFWRGKPGAISRAKDWLTGESGKQSEEDENASALVDEEKKGAMKAVKNIAKKNARKLPTSNSKDLFLEFIEAPGNKRIRDMFVKEFSDATDSDEISVADAKKYEKILNAFMQGIEKELSKEMPKFVKIIENVTSKIEKEVDKAEKETPDKSDTGSEKPAGLVRPATLEEQRQYGSEINGQMVDDIIDVWSSSNLKFKK